MSEWPRKPPSDRADWPRMRVHQEWCELVRVRMDELGITETAIERTTGVRQSTISDTLNGKHLFSKFVYPISYSIGLSWPPEVASKRQELSRLLATLSDDELAQVVEYATFLKSKK